jgi:hypothetical protein
MSDDDGCGKLDEPDAAADDDAGPEAGVGLRESRLEAADRQNDGDPGGDLEREGRRRAAR